MSNEPFPEKIDFEKLEDDFKRLHANQKLGEEIVETSQEHEQTKAEEKLREIFEECDKIISVLREALDKKEIPDWMQAEAILTHFEDKLQKAEEEKGRLREQQRLSQKYGGEDPGEIEEFEKLQKEQADAQKEISLAALKSLLWEVIQKNDDTKNMTVKNLLEGIEKELKTLRSRKKSF